MTAEVPPGTSDPRDRYGPRTALGGGAQGILLYGGLVDPDGRPVPGAHIWLHRLEPAPPVERYVRPSPGSYAASGLGPGTWRLWARAEAFRDVMRELELPADISRLREDVVLEPASIVKVRILDETGRPLHEVLDELAATRPDLRVVQVTALCTAEPPRGDFPPTAARDHHNLGIGRWTYGQGPFADRAMKPEYAGTLEIEADPPVYVSAVMRHRVLATAPVDRGQEEVTLTVPIAEVLGSLATVRLRAVDGATGRPVAGAEVELGDAQTGMPSRPTADDGVLAWPDLRPGLLSLSVTAQDRAGLRGTLLLEPGEELDLGDVPLWPPVEVEGTAVDPRGEPATCDVRAIPLDPRPGGERFVSSTGTRGTDDQGRFRLRLAPGRYLLFASGALGLLEEIDCSRGPVTGLRLPLRRATSLHLSAAFGKDEAFEVRVLEERGRCIYRALLYSHYVVDVALLPGTYRVQMAGPGGGVVREQTIELGAEPARVSLGR